MAFNNRVALITGAGRGIGKALALTLAQHGADVVLAARTKSDIDAVARQIKDMGRESLAVRADISIEKDVNFLVKRAVKKFGRIDILINNAGIGTFSSVRELAVKDFDSMWSINMRGTFLCTKAVLPAMIRQKSGDIVFIASLAGKNAFAGGAGYAATKWAMIGFSRCLMLEVRKHNIRVITICPGSVDTSFGDKELRKKVDNSAMPKPEDIARTALMALSAPRSVMVSEIDIRPTIPPKEK